MWLPEHVQYYEAYGFQIVGGCQIKKDLEHGSSGDLLESNMLQFWAMVKWPKQGSGDLEDTVSIVKDAEKRRQLIDSVPAFKLLSCDNEREIITFIGPEADKMQIYEDWVAGLGKTTYPLEPVTRERQGEPFADR